MDHRGRDPAYVTADLTFCARQLAVAQAARHAGITARPGSAERKQADEAVRWAMADATRVLRRILLRDAGNAEAQHLQACGCAIQIQIPILILIRGWGNCFPCRR